MTKQKSKGKVLIICNHNSARSQIAEGLLKSLYGEYYEVYSAGSNPTTVNPYAIKVLLEISVDISENRSKNLKEFEGLEFDYVVAVSWCKRSNMPIFLWRKNLYPKTI
jgi:arsenate reductase